MQERQQRSERSVEQFHTNQHQKDTCSATLALLSSYSSQETCNNLMGETINQVSCLHELVHAQSQNDQVRRPHRSKKMGSLVLFFALALVECDFFWFVTPQEGLLQKECNGSEYAVAGAYLSHLHLELSMCFSGFL